MRICFVHDVIGDLGGAEANVRHAATGLAGQGHEVALLHGKETGAGMARFHNLFQRRYDWQSQGMDAVAAALAWAPDVIYVHKLANIDVLERLVASHIPLVRMVHDHEMYCGRSYRYLPWNRKPCTKTAGWGCLSTCAVVRNRDGVLPLKLNWPGDKLRELELCRQFDRHIVVTPFMAKELIQHGFDAERISILPPVPRAAPADFTADYRDPEVLYVGQLIRGKGVDALIRSLAQCAAPDWRARIIGEGPHRQHCEQLAKRLGIADRVTFTGWIPQERLHEAYAHARCAVIPSLWPEPIATVGLELLHHGLPVVGFDAGGIGDWLRHGEVGLLVPWNDTRNMAAAIDSLIADQALAQHYGRNGREMAQREWIYDNYVHDLAFILEEHAGLADASGSWSVA